MKSLVLLISLLSCSAKTATSPDQNPDLGMSVENLQTNLKSINNKDNTATLHYIISGEKNSPVRKVEYYITDTKSGKIIKTKETVAAEKIYWKDNQSIAIVPYSDAPRQEVLGSPNIDNEIIVKIK